MAAKKYSKFTFKQLLIIVLCFAVGIFVGYVVCIQLCVDDGFELDGEKVYDLSVGEEFSYKEEGYHAMAFGKDYTDDVTVDCDFEIDGDKYIIDTDKAGKYSIKYTVELPFYGTVTRTRVFVVEDADNGDR